MSQNDEPKIPDDFTRWPGGECPEDARGQVVDVIFRNGASLEGEPASVYNWGWVCGRLDIIAYRVRKPAQPEPTDGQFSAADMSDARAAGYRDGVKAAGSQIVGYGAFDAEGRLIAYKREREGECQTPVCRGLYCPSLLRRRPDGQLWHPDLPQHDDPDSEAEIAPLIRAQGYEPCIVDGEGDGFPDDALSEGGDAYWGAMAAWQPTPPEGDGWLLAAIYDSEDGPLALFVRPLAMAQQPAASSQPPVAHHARDVGGRIVREAWVRWALTQPNPKPSWLAPYDELSEPDKEADRQIFEAVAGYLSPPVAGDVEALAAYCRASVAAFERMAETAAVIEGVNVAAIAERGRRLTLPRSDAPAGGGVAMPEPFGFHDAVDKDFNLFSPGVDPHMLDVYPEITYLYSRASLRTYGDARAAAALALKEDDVIWIVNDNAELGVMIHGRAFFLYKGDSLVYEDAKHDDGSPMHYRTVGKREFGECAHPINHEDYRKIRTVSLSDSDRWLPLPALTPSTGTEESGDAR